MRKKQTRRSIAAARVGVPGITPGRRQSRIHPVTSAEMRGRGKKAEPRSELLGKYFIFLFLMFFISQILLYRVIFYGF